MVAGGSIPRSEVHAAMADLFEHYAVRRVYCDPKDWKTEIEDWALEYGEKVVIQWATYRVVQMYEALKRFVTDLGSMDNEGRLVRPGTLTHDGCPITALHVGNARKLARPGDRYILGKPSQGQKIDAAVASVLAHEAAADARVDGWGRVEVDTRVFVLS
jgi:phage terminase large subunit-like protein